MKPVNKDNMNNERLNSDYSIELNDFNGFSILETARFCAEGENIASYWHSLLERMLMHWNANVEMDLDDAILYCVSATNITNDNYNNILNEICCIQSNLQQSWLYNSPFVKFWYLDKSPIRAMRIYRITVAVFESINYWCWHDSPLQITFSESELANCLQYPIHIDWEKYDGFLGYWKQQTE